MDCNPCESGKSNTMFGKTKSLYGMPELKAASCGAPRIRIVHINPPKVFKTDPANFGALVQKLTGKHSAHPSRQSFKKPQQQQQQKMKNPTMRSRRRKSCHHGKLSNIGKSQSVEDNLTWCDNFSGLLGVFDEVGIIATQMHSGSILPEFLTLDAPIADQTDTHSVIYGRALGI